MRVRSRLTKLDFGMIGRIFAEFGGNLRGQRSKLILSGVYALGVTLMTLAQPWPIKIALDYILIPSSNLSTTDPLAFLRELDPMFLLALVAIAVLVIAALRGVFNYGQETLMKATGHRIVGEIRLRVFAHIQRLPQSYHDYRETGELMTRLTGDMSMLRDLLVSSLISLGSQFTIIAGMLGLMFWLDWKLALVGVAVIPFFLLAAFRFSWRIRKSAREQREKYGKMVATVQESFAGIAQVKGFGREKQREKLIGKAMERDVKANLKTTRLAANYSRIVELITAVGISLALWVGVNRALDGAITAGDLIIFLAYLRGVYRPLRGVAKTTTKLAKASSRAEKILELLALEPEVKDKDNSVSARTVNGAIEFDNVTFSYSGENKILDKFCCRLPVGKTTLIIGHTGAGKSTIAKLLLRLYEPSAGVISIDGRDIAEFRINSLRKKMTPLTQETFLFRTTIRENIAFGKRRATDEEIESASRQVGADKFIRSMPDGYETLVGEGGATLSGGQRQLISFARAALRNTSIMIFDEPATGLDIHAEREARNALKSLKPDGVMIIISHRLAFLEMADWVVFIRDGQLVEEGEPSSLLESHGPLYHYVKADDESYAHSKKTNQHENVSE